MTTLCSGVKVQPFQVAVHTCPHDGHVWPLVSPPGIHAPSNRLPQPGQSSGECSVILIPGRSSPLPATGSSRPPFIIKGLMHELHGALYAWFKDTRTFPLAGE